MEPTISPAGNNSKNVIYIVLAIIVVAVIAYFIYMSPSQPAQGNTTTGQTNTGGQLPATETPKIDPAALASKKAEILKLVSSGKALTVTEKQTIFQALSGNQLSQYNFTEAERTKIIGALNK